MFFVFCLSGAVPVGFEAEDNFAFTAAEKVAVLEKAEETLKWVKSLPKTALDAMPPEIFRTKITPLELMQAAALLREANQIMTSVKLREIFSLLNPTPSECFDIEERLGAAVLDSFKNDAELPQSKVGGGGGWDGVGLNSADFIRKGAEKFLRDDLTAAERIAIMNSPKTPLDIMKTADVLAATGRAALARGYLKRFLDTKNTPAECAEIVDKIGTTRLMQISVSRKLMPRGKDAVARILQEAKKYWQDKNVIAKAADNLTIKFDQRYQNNDRLSLDDFNPPLILPESLKTLQTIWKGEHVSAENLLSKLANINDNNRADEIIAALLSIGGDVKESLAVSLNSDNPVLLKHVVRGLGVAVSRDEVFLLYPAAFSQKKTVPDEIKNEAYNIILSKTVGKNKNNIRNDIKKNAVITLYNRARDYYFRNRHLRANEDGVIRFWNWNDNKSCAEYIQLSLPDAYRLFAYRYARLAYEIADKGGEGFEIVQRFYVAALFDYVSYSNGIDQPLDLDSSGLLRIVSSLPLVQLDRIITDAIRERHFEVARVAAKIWARVGNSNSFVNSGSQPHPLIRAVSASDRRLRFTALETIMQLNPSVPYQGSSLVTDALVWFARSEGQKTVVVVHPKLSEASRFYGHFIPLGYAGELAVTCRKGFMLAAESPDVELVVVDSIFPESTVSEFVQTLRSDNRTHDIPVAIYKAEPQRKPKVLQNIPNAIELKLMQQTDRNQPDSSFVTSLSLSYPRSADDAAARFVEADLLQKTSTIIVPAEIRLEQAKKSLNWIKQTIANTKTGQKVYHYENADELILRAIQNSKHVIEGLAIATEIKSATMQLAIFNTAADATLPITIRQQAAQFFETSIKTHGVMPRGKQIQSLYDRYNASEFEPKESQDLLNRMIDIIEEKALKQKSK
ncbi:MAG: hypothetical protein LBT09_09855 [Planctomycetaceae bacterium]|nr:hypothetical protein [Planctomycetaceae bacterium]